MTDGASAHHARKQQVGFLGVVQALGEFVDVEQHGAQHVEELLGVVSGAVLDHHGHGAEHGGQ